MAGPPQAVVAPTIGHRLVAKPQAFGRRDARRRCRLALPDQDVEHHVGAAGAAGKRLGASRLDRLQPVLQHRRENLDELPVAVVVGRQPGPQATERVGHGRARHRAAGEGQAQLAAIALTAVAPLADTAVRRRVLRKDLRIATEKLAKLTQNSAGRRAEYQAAMEGGLATALVALGRRETGTEFFQRAVEGYRAALKVFSRERHPEQWGQGMNDLGVALVALAEREIGTERLREAVSAYRTALKERTRERAPFDWARTQNNLGVALAKIGERESNAGRLEEAIAAYRSALQERSREREPLD